MSGSWAQKGSDGSSWRLLGLGEGGEIILAEAFLEAVCVAGCKWWVGCDGADWWSRSEGCYTIGDEHVVEKNRRLKMFQAMKEVLMAIWFWRILLLSLLISVNSQCTITSLAAEPQGSLPLRLSCHWIRTWASFIQLQWPRRGFLRYVLILWANLILGVPSGRILIDFPNKILWHLASLPTYTRA